MNLKKLLIIWTVSLFAGILALKNPSSFLAIIISFNIILPFVLTLQKSTHKLID